MCSLWLMISPLSGHFGTVGGCFLCLVLQQCPCTNTISDWIVHAATNSALSGIEYHIWHSVLMIEYPFWPSDRMQAITSRSPIFQQHLSVALASLEETLASLEETLRRLLFLYRSRDKLSAVKRLPLVPPAFLSIFSDVFLVRRMTLMNIGQYVAPLCETGTYWKKHQKNLQVLAVIGVLFPCCLASGSIAHLHLAAATPCQTAWAFKAQWSCQLHTTHQRPALNSCNFGGVPWFSKPRDPGVPSWVAMIMSHTIIHRWIGPRLHPNTNGNIHCLQEPLSKQLQLCKS